MTIPIYFFAISGLGESNLLYVLKEATPEGKVIIAVLVGASIVYAATTSGLAVSNVSNGVSQLPENINNVVRIGQLLYSPTSYSYVLQFEIASLVLLVAIVGAIVIGRED